MLLRYVALKEKVPSTDEEWAAYRVWKARQLVLAECQMTEVDGTPEKLCENCPGNPDCPKANRRPS